MASCSAGLRLTVRSSTVLALLAAGGMCVLVWVGGQGCRRAAQRLPFTPFELSTLDPSRVSAMDGDSVGYGGVEIRLLGIDAPEMVSPYYEGDQEPEASEATSLLAKMLREATRIEVICLDEYDKYNRPLGYVLADGRNVNAEMVRAGMACENISFYGHQGLSAYAEEVSQAASEAPALKFEDPHIWRNKHRKTGQ